MKKVLLVATVQSHIAQFHKLLSEVLHAHGCEIHVAARDNLSEKNGLQLDFADKVFDLPLARSPKSLDNIQAYRELKKIIERGNYDVVHCNTPMGGIVTRLAARKSRNNGTMVIYTAHGFHFYKGAPIRNWLFFYPIEKLFSLITDKLITITYEDYELARKEFHCKVFHIHGVGVDENRFFPVSQKEKEEIRTTLKLHHNQKIILCIGELLPNKNQAMAIKMMEIVRRTYSDALLLLAGNGPEQAALEKLISDLDLQNNVRLLGYCTCLEKYQRASDVLVSCSKREGLPLNVVEAMLSGNPVVVTNNRGHRELVKNGENGYLVSDNDIENMAQMAIRLLEEPIVHQEIGANALAFASKYSGTRVKQEIERVYFGNIKI